MKSVIFSNNDLASNTNTGNVTLDRSVVVKSCFNIIDLCSGSYSVSSSLIYSSNICFSSSSHSPCFFSGMALNQGETNIQVLLDAEKEASEMIHDARKLRNEKMKQAKIEAYEEIEELKNNLNKEQKEYEESFSETWREEREEYKKEQNRK
eukprot:GHVR01108329.1.p1 GENE.GHVR01108329.1~~GHVR01108329.1.p1  ORF type:complete len:151 (-),score=21.91 GHVR01108329.1:273-725(-)